MAKTTQQQDAAAYTGAAQDAGAVGRAILDVYNARAFDRLDALFAPDAEYRNVATGEVFRGGDGVRRYQRNWASGFPDSRVELLNVVACGESVTLEYVGTGRHTGPLHTPNGTLAATGREVKLPLCDVLTVRGGRITGGRTYYDAATLARQLGM